MYANTIKSQAGTDFKSTEELTSQFHTKYINFMTNKSISSLANQKSVTEVMPFNTQGNYKHHPKESTDWPLNKQNNIYEGCAENIEFRTQVKNMSYTPCNARSTFM